MILNKMLKSFTDLLPVVGGASGGALAADKASLITVGSVLVFIGMTITGAVIGYFVKMLLDKIVKKKTNGK